MRVLDRRLLQRARSARIALGADVVLGICAALLILAQAMLLARVVARSFDGGSLRDVAMPLALLLLVVGSRAAATWGFESIGTRAAAGVVSQLRLDLVTSRLKGNPAALDGTESAEVATAAVSGVAALEGLFGRYLPQLVLAVIVPIAVLVLVAALDPVSAGLMLLTLPLVPVFFWLIGRTTGARARQRWEAMSLLATHFLDVVRGLPTLRAFNRGEMQAAQIERVSDEYRRTTMSTLRLAFLSGTVLELAATLGVALVAVTVGVRLVNGGIAFEPALTVLVLAPELYSPLRNLAAGFHASADGAAVANRLLDLIEQPAALTGGDAEPPDVAVAAIRFDAVSFAYPDRAASAVSAVSLTIEPGETVALIGPSGGGKSTIVALLLRLRTPSAGRVLVGATDLGVCDPAAWHRQIAWLPQDPTLFRGTIAENIRLGAPSASDARVHEAVVLAGAEGLVDSLPDGVMTVVGEGGRVLSTGERQRVALARVFLRQAPLVVLDEPTANLDPTSARLVGEAVARLQERRTLVISTHDPALAMRADRIVTVTDGRISEPTR